jgi:hypothetical protein
LILAQCFSTLVEGKGRREEGKKGRREEGKKGRREGKNKHGEKQKEEIQTKTRMWLCNTYHSIQ